MDETRSLPSPVLLLDASLPVTVELTGETRRVELVAASGAVRIVLPTCVHVCPPDRLVSGETADGQAFREVAGVLYLDAAERQGIPLAVI
jgi:hypothetical protein